MASTASASLNLELQNPGENDSTWGDKQRTNMQIIDAAIAGRTTVSLSGADATLADVDYMLDAGKNTLLYTSDADQNDRAIIIPNAQRVYRVVNASGSYQIGVKTFGGTAVTIPLQSSVAVACDGNNGVVFASPITNASTGAPNTSSGAAAITIPVSPSGDLTSINVQAALAELQADIDAIEASMVANYQPHSAGLDDIAALGSAKGALIAGNSSAWSKLTVGTNGYALIADSASAAGVKWAPLIPAGTSMLFYKSTAPTGWTAVAQNNKALRVVSAATTGGTAGGTTSFSGVFASRTIATTNLPSHTHSFSATTSSDGAHQHFVFNSTANTGISLTSSNYPSYAYTAGNPASGYVIYSTTNACDIGLSSSTGAHTHSASGTSGSTGSGTAMDFSIQYCDVIIATKDSY